MERLAARTQQNLTFGENRLLRGMLGVYLLLWTATSISPVDRVHWFLENLLVFVLFAVLIGTYNRFRFSDLSYTLIFIFLCLHAVGAHYTYGQVPFGFWLRDEFHLDRNHFDRIAHFSFGLLSAYPIREVFLRNFGVSRGWSFYFPLEVVLAFSAFFELLEALIAQMVSADLAAKYLGSQGDLWDAQNDIATALLGACITVGLMWRRERRGTGADV